jgi:hypothetical protein
LPLNKIQEFDLACLISDAATPTNFLSEWIKNKVIERKNEFYVVLDDLKNLVFE